MIKEIAGWIRQVMLLDHQIKSLEEKLKGQSQQIESLEDQNAALEYQIKMLEERRQAEVDKLQNELRHCAEGLQKLRDDFPPLFQEVRKLADESKGAREDGKERERNITRLSENMFRIGVKLELVQQIQISHLNANRTDSLSPAHPPFYEQAQLSIGPAGLDGDSVATEFDDN